MTPTGTMRRLRQAGSRLMVSVDELERLRHKAKGFSFLPRQPVHSILTGRHSSRLRGRGLNFEELRPYYPGDDTRTIDWNATARLRDPFVRVYTEERDRSVMLLVDQRLSMFFGSRGAVKSVVAAEIAAASAFRITSLGDRVGAVVFADDGMEIVRPQARDHGARAVIDAVVTANRRLPDRVAHAPNPQAFNDALRRAARFLKHDGLLCLITDAAGADPETIELVTTIMAHNDALAIFIYDPLEVDLPKIGTAIVAEADSQIEIDTNSADLRRRFSNDFDQRRRRIEGFSRKRSIPVLPIRADRDPIDQLRELLGRRTVHAVRGTSRPAPRP